MPSIEIELALVVFQLNCTWSPAEITVGVALNCAVGAPPEFVVGASSADGKGVVFFLQPETATSATSKRAIEKMDFCVLKGILLLKKGQVALSGNRVFLSPQRAAFRFQHP
jgi:hypothetical protein